MKNLIIVAFTLTTITSAFACTITLTKTSVKAKSAKLNGVSVSKKVRAALETQCTIKYRVMNEQEKRAAKILRLQKQLKKLQSNVINCIDEVELQHAGEVTTQELEGMINECKVEAV